MHTPTKLLPCQTMTSCCSFRVVEHHRCFFQHATRSTRTFSRWLQSPPPVPLPQSNSGNLTIEIRICTPTSCSGFESGDSPVSLSGPVRVEDTQGVINYFETYYGQIAAVKVKAGSIGTMDDLIPELADTLRNSVNITTIVRDNDVRH